MLSTIIKFKLKILFRNFLYQFKKQNLIRTLIICLITLNFFANFLFHIYNLNKLLLANSNLERINKVFKNQLAIFFVFFIMIIISKIYEIYSREDKNLSISPISDKTLLSYNILRISIIIVLFDLFFIIFFKGFLFKLSHNLLYPITLLILIQSVIVFFFLYFIYKSLLHKRRIFTFLFSLFSLLILWIIVKPKYAFYFLSLCKKHLFTVPFNYFVSLLTLEQNKNIYLAFYLLSFAFSFLLFQMIKHNFNPLFLSLIGKDSNKRLTRLEIAKREKKEIPRRELFSNQFINKNFIIKDIKILFREVGSRIIVISFLFSLFILFSSSLLREGKIIQGKIFILASLGYFIFFLSWLIALPSVGSEGLFLGILRTSVSLKKLLKSKLFFSFVVNSFLGLIISSIGIAFLFKNDFLDFSLFLSILFTIFEFGFILSLCGVIIGSFFPNLKDKSKERLKKVSFGGQIVYFISASFLILIALLLDLLTFKYMTLFLLGGLIFCILAYIVSIPLLNIANIYLSKIEL